MTKAQTINMKTLLRIREKWRRMKVEKNDLLLERPLNFLILVKTTVTTKSQSARYINRNIKKPFKRLKN